MNALEDIGVAPSNSTPSRRTILTDLLARVEAARIGSRELDGLVHVALSGGRLTESDRCGWVKGANNIEAAPRLTASVDAALALLERVLPGWRAKLSNVGDAWAYAELFHPGPPLTGRVSGWVFETAGEAKTLPTSVLAAILRVLIEREEAALSPQPGDS